MIRDVVDKLNRMSIASSASKTISVLGHPIVLPKDTTPADAVATLPPWLQLTTRKDDYFIQVLRALSQREIARKQAPTWGPPAKERANAAQNQDTPSPVENGDLRAYFATELSEDNASHNRYYDIEPYDRTIVSLKSLDHTYLNANWVKEVAGSAWWIAGQAPLPRSAHAFLSLCTSLAPVHQRVRVIVQLTSFIEGRMRKADPYFPTEIGETLRFRPREDLPATVPSIDVTLVDQAAHESAGCVRRTLKLRLTRESSSERRPSSVGSEQSFHVHHLLFSAWPDHGVPLDHEEILNLATLTESLNSSPVRHPNAPPSRPDGLFPPILCHCSAGIGRTGTFIALSSLLRSSGILPSHTYPSPSSSPREGANNAPPFNSPLPSLLGPLPKDIQQDLVAQEVDGLREQRTGMLQRPEQIKFVYSSLAAALIRKASSGPSAASSK
ncbi:hypothetical protein BOTBODRAFT_31455 [Botryobasidium botryosum FD-172 SS1]|uniref:Tyrosine specific protein phosphatases domain-containing protein n=1 Tax=Botryobasidium botryosum (strain FD-172 SS1) TaxID=930990 RepID=A0A067MUK8_BOTB1|nr:hypothetical protein BOTBODRAFT_31455 [Botryobasidium botryosum FD-172 SS1]